MNSNIKTGVGTIIILVQLASASSDQLYAAVGTLADSSGEIVAWGANDFGQLNVPAGEFKTIAAAPYFSLGIRSDGTLAGWGFNFTGQINVPSGTFTAVAAGGDYLTGNGRGLALRTDGALTEWGFTYAAVPNVAFDAVAAGAFHSLAIRVAGGTLAGWGTNCCGQIDVPSGAFTAVAAGGVHSLGIRNDGTLAGWGSNDNGQIDVPSGAFIAVAAGNNHSLGIRDDGTLAGWGSNFSGQTDVPSGAFVAIAGGHIHSLGIRDDGTLAGWGSNSFGQTNVPSGIFVAVAGAYDHSVALRARTSYDGDLLVKYNGDPYGPNGLKANLNRSVTVAGNARIESALYMINNPLLSVAGNVTFADSASVGGYGTISAGGGLEVASGLLFYVPPELTLSAAGPLMGGGGLYLQAGARLTAGMTAASSFTGDLYIENGATLNFTGAGFTSPSFLTVYAGGNLRLAAGQRLQMIGGGANDGRIELLGNAAIGGASEIEFAGTATNATGIGLITGHNAVMRFSGGLTNDGALALTGGSNDIFGDTQNNLGASVTVTGGATTTFYDDVINDGTITVRKLGSNTATAIFLGSFSGSGGTGGGGDIIFEGDLRPGNSPASVTFSNNVAVGSGATLAIELGGTSPGSQHDQLIVAGDLSLAGVLDVSLLPGFTPAAGQSFDLLDWGTLSGSFSSLSLPTLAGLTWNTSQLYTTGVLSVAAAAGLPGDYNGDGFVDAADYVVWRKNLGSGTSLLNDDTPGVGEDDYDRWRTNFGATLGIGSNESAAVPEPCAVLLLLTAGTFGLLRTRRLRRSVLYDH